MAQGRSTEIITMIKWIRTSRLSIKELSLSPAHAEGLWAGWGCDFSVEGIPYVAKRWSHWHVSLGNSLRIRIQQRTVFQVS